MMKIIPLALIAFNALPSVAADFDAGVNVAEFVGQARAAAAAAPAPAASFSFSAPSDVDAISPARRIELILRAPEWTARKADMREALDTFVSNRIRKEGHAAEWRGWATRVWELAESIERQQNTLAERVGARIAAEERDPAERARRIAAVGTLRDFRKFTAYGNIIPRVIDEAVTDNEGQPGGHEDAGPRWGIVMTFEEAQAVNRSVIALTGISPEDYRSMGDAVAKEDKAAHPMTPVPGQRDN